MEAKKEIQIHGTPGLVQPAFADSILVTLTVKENKETKERAGMMRLTFVDMIRSQVLSEIVIDHLHARDLLKVLSENVGKLDEAIKTGRPLVKEVATTKDLDTKYIR